MAEIERNLNFKQWFNVFLVISEAWQGYDSKAYGVLNHNLKLQCKKFSRTRDIPNFPTQGWAGTAFARVSEVRHINQHKTIINVHVPTCRTSFYVFHINIRDNDTSTISFSMLHRKSTEIQSLHDFYKSCLKRIEENKQAAVEIATQTEHDDDPVPEVRVGQEFQFSDMSTLLLETPPDGSIQTDSGCSPIRFDGGEEAR